MNLEAPLPGRAKKVRAPEATPATLAREGEEFMSFMTAMTSE